MADVLFNKEQGLKEYEERKMKYGKMKKIDNSTLPAGSPMHYYCRYCGAPTEILPHQHVQPARTVCNGCYDLQVHGVELK